MRYPPIYDITDMDIKDIKATYPKSMGGNRPVLVHREGMTYHNTKILQYTDRLLCKIQSRTLPELRWTYEAFADPFLNEPGYLYRITWMGKQLNLFCTENSYKNTTEHLILYAFLGEEDHHE